MTASVAQSAVFGSTSTSGTIAVTITGVTAGSCLRVVFGFLDNNSIIGVVDSSGDTCTKIGSTLDDTTNFWKLEQWYVTNAAAGSHTFTATLSFAQDERCAYVQEVAGVNAFQGGTGQWQVSPTTSTDATSSGTFSVVSQPAILVGFSSSNLSSNPPAVGTGFTSDGSGSVWNGGAYGYRGEWKRVTATGSQAATFTAAVNESHHSLIAVFTETATTRPRMTLLGC